VSDRRRRQRLIVSSSPPRKNGARKFSPRAGDCVTLTRTGNSGSMRVVVPLGTALSPGDTMLVGERWF
jgi:hypothetical protein